MAYFQLARTASARKRMRIVGGTVGGQGADFLVERNRLGDAVAHELHISGRPRSLIRLALGEVAEAFPIPSFGALAPFFFRPFKVV